MNDVKVLCGDCQDRLHELPDHCIDACITDPPYGLSFLRNQWDHHVPSIDVWHEVLRVLKPGGYLIAFCGTRTYHRMVVAIEDAGFTIRDQLGWIYTTGYPKSMDVGRMIDKAERGVPQGGRDHTSPNHGNYKGGSNMGAGPGQFMKQQGIISKPRAEDLTPNAQQWLGWGTALKPSFEPAVLAQKPTNLTIASNVMTYGTGAININAGKIMGDDGLMRFPANTMTDGGDDVISLFPSSEMCNRYFYCAKATEADKAGSNHPTVKPIALMRHLCRLVTRRGGVVLDPFAGSGTTGEAALREGMDAILIEQDPSFCEAMRRRFSIPTIEPDCNSFFTFSSEPLPSVV